MRTSEPGCPAVVDDTQPHPSKARGQRPRSYSRRRPGRGTGANRPSGPLAAKIGGRAAVASRRAPSRRRSVGRKQAGHRTPRRSRPGSPADRRGRDRGRPARREGGERFRRSGRGCRGEAATWPTGRSATRMNTGWPKGAAPSSLMRPEAARPATTLPRSLSPPARPEIASSADSDRTLAAATRRRPRMPARSLERRRPSPVGICSPRGAHAMAPAASARTRATTRRISASALSVAPIGSSARAPPDPLARRRHRAPAATPRRHPWCARASPAGRRNAPGSSESRTRCPAALAKLASARSSLF